jgi:hypothetical protein
MYAGIDIPREGPLFFDPSDTLEPRLRIHGTHAAGTFAGTKFKKHDY